MKTISICAAKGGTTKTTLTLNLAVRACADSLRVAMFDLNDDQGDLTKWWMRRGEPMNPRLLPEIDNISRDVEAARQAGYEYLFIDTPPLDLDIIENAIIKSDAVVIPVRPGYFDYDAVGPLVEICRRRRRSFSFLLSAVDTQRMGKVVEATLQGLTADGPVFATRIRYLQAYVASLGVGRSAAEFQKDCRAEIDSLWSEVRRLAGCEEGVSPSNQGARVNG